MENRRNLLVTLADNNYIPQAKQLFSSAYWNGGWSGDYMLLSHEISDEELKWFTDKGILVKKCKTLYNGPMGDGHYSYSVVDKFYLFTEEFKKWEHIVFLDADIIVRAPIDEMAHSKTFSSPQIFKKNFKTHFFKTECKERKLVEKEYNLQRPAFNSGVFSFNTDLIKDDTFNKIIAVFYKYANISNGDDSILNLFFYDQWIKIPLVYNVQVNYIGLNKYKGIILHFQRHSHYFPLEDPKNPFNQEWKSNLEKAEFIDLNNIQKVKKWTHFKIKYYALFLSICLFVNRIIYKIRYFDFPQRVRNFFLFKLRPFFRYIIKTPDRFIGKIGNFIKKYNPDLYHKLRKVKGGK